MIVVTVMSTNCGLGEEKKPSDQVTVQLKWIHQAQFAGLYIADKKGFYAKENIDVTLLPANPETNSDIITNLVAGDNQFAITSGDKLIQACSEGEPVVAIAAIFQKNPYVYLSLKESGIQRPSDLVGKKIMVPPDAELLHIALMRKLDIDPNSIEVIPYEQGVVPLTTGQVDAYMVYRTATGLAFDETGCEFNIMWLEDYGIHGYADTIITTKQLVQQDPELVERFLRATLKGWCYAIENPDEAVDVTLQYDYTLNRELQARMMTIQTPIIHTGRNNIGWMEENIWQGMCDTLLGADILTQQINVSEVYTMEFLNNIYGKGE